MEYLMTYGWAILIVVVVLAALLYMGIFGLGGRVPEQCTFKPGLLCTGVKVTPTSVSFTLTNVFGSKIEICNIVCDASKTSATVDLKGSDGKCDSPIVHMSLGDERHLSVADGCHYASGEIVPAGETYRDKLLITYYKEGDTDLPRTVEGQLVVTVNP
ncbi:Uncharacterised protein [Candidatus Burarchaeum australiense]|nr:Uncharacterised protein [Candidatus Burarchaeum australiense]